MTPKIHYLGTAPKIHYLGLTHQAITPAAFGLILAAVILALAVTMLALRRRVYG